LPEPKGHDLPHFEAISQTLLPQLPPVVQIGFAWLPRLSGWQRQTLYIEDEASGNIRLCWVAGFRCIPQSGFIPILYTPCALTRLSRMHQGPCLFKNRHTTSH
jgi:hypothetical protein